MKTPSPLRVELDGPLSQRQVSEAAWGLTARKLPGGVAEATPQTDFSHVWKPQISAPHGPRKGRPADKEASDPVAPARDKRLTCHFLGFLPFRG